MKILFLGSPKFAQKVLESLVKSRHEVVAVVCQPDNKVGKKVSMPPAKMFALEHEIKVLQFEKVSNHIGQIKTLDFDLFVTASFGQILSREFLELGLGLNVHPSLLPALRGPTPIQTALMQNLSETGVTIQKMTYEVDAGDIILQQSLKIELGDDYQSLEDKLVGLSCQLLAKALDLIEQNAATFTPQKGTPTFTRMIQKSDERIDFSKPVMDVYGQIRALSHNPGCYFELNSGRVKVLKAQVFDECAGYSPGDIVPIKKHFVIKCLDGAIEILKLISPSGKTMQGDAFLNGIRGQSKVKTCF